MAIFQITALACATGNWLVGDVVIVRFGILENDVPGVDQTWDKTQHTEGYVDDGIGRADPRLDPYC